MQSGAARHPEVGVSKLSFKRCKTVTQVSGNRVLLLLFAGHSSLCVALGPVRRDVVGSAALEAFVAGAKTFAQGQTAAAASPAELFGRGKQALERGQLTLAEECFRQVVALDPGSASAHTNLAVTYMRERRWDDALAELHRAETIKPDDPGIELNIGLAHYRKNDFASAIVPFEESLQHAPESGQARYLLGLCHFFTYRYADATTTLAPLWEKQSSNLNYLYVLSIAASKAENAELQQKAFARMLATGQNTPEFHLYLGKAWLAEHDTGKALQEFMTAAQARPDLPLVHYFLGRTYLEQRDYKKAEDELLKDTVAEPEFAYSYENLGLLYAQTNRPVKAEENFRKAIGRNQFLGNSYFGLAKLYRDSGRLNEALAALDKAETMAPQSASLHYTKGQVLTRLGNRETARQEFAKSAELLHSFNDRLQQGGSGDQVADAQGAAEQ